MADINQIKVKGVVYDVADEAARNAIKQKQNILIPGDNITIKENVISANVSDTEGTVTGIIMNGKEKTPNANGMVDLGTVVTDVSGKVDKEDGKSLFSGSYDDLTDKPQIPQSVTDLNDAEDYVATEQLNDKIDSINDALSEKANVNDMSITSGNGSATITLKQGVSATVLTQHQDISGKADKSEMSVDDVTGDSTKKKVTLKHNASVDVVVQHQSLANYYNKGEVDQKIAQASQGETVVTSVDDMVLVDGFNSNTVLAGATARSVKELYDNVMALRNALAGIAFKDSIPAWITVPQITYSMDTSGLTNFATPQTTSWVEGSEVTVVLSAAAGYVLNASVASAMTVTDMEDNALTLLQNPTFDSTGGTISFKIAHIDRNFKVTGAAAQALAVTMKANSHLNLSPEGVISGETFSGTITPNNGYKLPTAINGSDVSGTHGTVTFTRTSDTEGTISIANVQSAVTINADAVPLDTYSVTIDDNNTGKVSGSNNNAPTEGQPWSTVISLSSSASEDDSITGITAAMEGGQIGVNGNTVSTNSVTGDITITVTVATVSRHTIALPTNEHVVVKASDNSTVLKASDDTNPTNPQVTDGGTFECYLSEDQITDTTNEIHYDIVDVSVKLGNNVVANAFDPLTGRVTLQDVDDNVTIEVKTLSFVGSCIIDASGNQVNRVNTHTFCATNEFIDIPAGTSRIVYDSGLAISEGNIAIYDESGTMTKYKACTKRYNWIDVDSTDKKLKMTFGCSAKNNASIRKGRYIVCLDSNYDFIGYAYKGINYDGYYEDASIQGVTNKILYCARLNSNTAGIEQFTNYDVGVCATRLIPVADNIPDGVTAVEFSCNGTSSTADRFGTYTSSTAKPSVTNMDSVGTPKSVSISGKTHIALSANDIDHSFIRYTYNGEYVYLFKGLYVVEETLTNEE